VHYGVDVAVRCAGVLFGRGDGVSGEFFGDGGVEVFDVGCGGGVLVFVLYG